MANGDDDIRPDPVAIATEPRDSASIHRDDVAASDLLSSAAPLLWSETNGAAFQHLSERLDQPCAAVVDERARVVGVIDRGKLLATFGQTFGRAIYEKRPVSALMDPDVLVVDWDLDIDEITGLIADEYPGALNTGFVITRRGLYVGIGRPVNLLAKRRERAQKRAMELEELNRRIEQANAAKSGFLATMSHEIRTPLNGVIGNLELVRLTGLSDEQSEFIDNAQISAETLLGIIGDILDFSKIEAGKIDIEHAEASPEALLDDVEALLSSRAAQKGLTLESHVGPGVPRRVKTDAFRLKQILMNFVSNALKFTENGRVRISASLVGAAEREGWTRLRFDCIDTGAGFAPDKAATLFEAFTQEDSSTTRRFGGTGLGLAICKKIMALMGGRIGAVGAPGAGAMFWCEVPVETVDASAATPPNLGGLAALYVRAGAPETPFRAGPGLSVVASLDKAVARLREARAAGHPFDVAAVHDRAEDGDGVNLAVLAGDAAPSAMILIADGDDPATPMRAYGLGYAAVIHPPVDAETLNHAIAGAVGRLPRRRPNAVRRGDAAEQAARFKARSDARPVLVIDDTPMNRVVARKQLRAFGIAPEEAEDGAQGLAKALNGDWSMIFVDCNMPVMDGFEFARRLRAAEAADPSRRRLPVIAMTGNALEGDRQRCLDAGMDDYLTKPVTLERMATALARWHPAAAADGEEAAVTADAAPTAPSQPAPSPDAKGPVDLAALADLLGEEDLSEVAEMLDLFVDTFPELLDRLRGAVDVEDATAVRDAAHAAKSAARNAAANSLGALMADMEKAAPDGDFGALAAMTEEAQRLFRAVDRQVAALPRGGAAA